MAKKPVRPEFTGDLSAPRPDVGDPSEYEDKDIDDEDNPELTEEDFARAIPFKDAHPEFYAAWVKNGRKMTARPVGRPPIESPKRKLTLRLSPDVIDGVKATGPGYNVRIENVLRAALAKGEL